MKLNYETLLSTYPWIVEEGRDCILSPDSDGLLCGLFMSHYLGWKIRGFYDGKVLLLAKGIEPKECVFLDMEIYRKGVKSVGQHMIQFDKKNLPKEWDAFSDCISANNLHNYDFKNDFKSKYPLGTIHLLTAIVGKRHKIGIKKDAVSSLLYTDGTFKSQFNYPENCIEWLEFLGASEFGNPLQRVFMDPHYSTYELMLALRDIFSDIRKIGGNKRGGDKIKISDSKGNVVSIDSIKEGLNESVLLQAENFLNMLSERTGWIYKRSAWSWGSYTVRRFKKGSVKPGKARYNDLLAKLPLSFAITRSDSIEYTLDTESVF
ncbi:MAG: hypothetical protein A3C07_00755 [Candidatus Sungbacteria bacterium RIFCSPHIGHO2_02_FULL_47_11]|uniref:Uncharacterized protein n=1 Tax=Candidatus Sungbacteria bacterium RIFCSPHIGHO2_02_FULL_47_11 TaxID=1802270 RepID=A0A1G2KMH6_9BACT|nr:MAG: hypothetical protein A3C07_00755 [Candidatus Sungbacteria bacterium RIFCSPHIGHO2_02_FULL_47_11]